MQRPRKKARSNISKTHLLSRARWAAVNRILVNKIKNLLVWSIKVPLPDCNDRDRPRDVRRSHSPVKLELPGAGGLGGPWWRFFLWDWCCVWWVALRRARVSERRKVLGRWSLCLQLTCYHEGINIVVTKCPEISSFAVGYYDFWASCLIFIRSWDLHMKEWVCMLFCLPGYNENRKNV